MSRRMLDSSIWSNEKFAALPPRGRLLQIGMITIADDQGRLKAHPLYLAKEIFPYDHMEPVDIEKWLAQMQENRTIGLYTIDGKQYAQLLNWWEYQALQFAKPSSYPRPEGWLDCIRFNGKGNQMMVCNWTTPKGEKMLDTCDQEGKPLPFVMNLPVAKAPTVAPAGAASEVRTSVATEVPAQVGTQAPTQVATKVRTQVNHDQDQDHDQLNLTKSNTTTNARAFAHTLMLSEWNGGDGDVDALPDDEVLIAALWLWHYKKLKAQSDYQRNDYAEAYRPSPFVGIENAVGFIRRQIEKKSAPKLRPAHRAEFDAELRRLQEPS